MDSPHTHNHSNHSLGTLFIVSAPSGAGKTTLVHALLQQIPMIKKSVSHTTREKRSKEENGIDYHFVTETEFKSLLKQNKFLEHAQVFGNFYGTSQTFVEQNLREGMDVILEIDWQGARQIRKLFTSSRSVFILPPSHEALLERLQKRHQDNTTIIDHRMSEAKSEISHYLEYDYLIFNESFDQALEDFKAIIIANRLRLDRQKRVHKEIIEGLIAKGDPFKVG